MVEYRGLEGSPNNFQTIPHDPLCLENPQSLSTWSIRWREYREHDRSVSWIQHSKLFNWDLKRTVRYSATWNQVWFSFIGYVVSMPFYFKLLMMDIVGILTRAWCSVYRQNINKVLDGQCLVLSSAEALRLSLVKKKENKRRHSD